MASEPANPFTLQTADGRARRGRLALDRGLVETPAFMPVGTAAAVKAMLPKDLVETGAQMVLANTYHLTIRPGEERIARLGGLHGFMGWDGPILTDSGGFQVFSLPGREIDEQGVRFRFELSGERILLSPERSMEIQRQLGADVAMAFDECIPYPVEKDYAARSVERTLRWAERCLAAHDGRSAAGGRQLLFGIAQGGVFEDLRRRCAQELARMPFHGYAIGGVSVGEGLDNLKRAVEFTEPHLPRERVRYLMGVGLPEDLLAAIERGMDIFDCVIPTRFGRAGTLFTARGRIRIEHNRYRRDAFPIDSSCDCYACTRFTRAYLRHLFQGREFLGTMLASIHNLRFYQRLMAGARRAIEEGRFAAFKETFLREYGAAAAPAAGRPDRPGKPGKPHTVAGPTGGGGSAAGAERKPRKAGRPGRPHGPLRRVEKKRPAPRKRPRRRDRGAGPGPA